MGENKMTQEQQKLLQALEQVMEMSNIIESLRAQLQLVRNDNKKLRAAITIMNGVKE
jgi:SMC interacting uncharacterized protein involved in chromosome segregation